MNSIDYAVIVVGLAVEMSFSGVWLPWIVGNVRYGWTESVRQWREAPHGRFPGGSPRPMAWPPAPPPPPPPLRHGDRRPPQPPYRASAKPTTDDRRARGATRDRTSARSGTHRSDRDAGDDMTPERLAQLRLTAADTTDAPCDEHCAAARRGDVRDLLAEVDLLTRLLVGAPPQECPLRRETR